MLWLRLAKEYSRLEKTQFHLVNDSVPSVLKTPPKIEARLFCQLLFTCDKSISKYISGAILSHDAFSLRADDGVMFVQHLRDRGIVPGISIDQGRLPGMMNDETTAEGINGSGLADKCKQFHALGARFAKVRCVFKTGNGGEGPSQFSINTTANTLVQFVSICQANDLAVIVEVDVLSAGSHDLESSSKIVQRTLSTIYKALGEHRVYLEGTVIKPCMVVPGAQYTTQYTPEQIAEATVTVLQSTLPVAVPGVVFLSGGQSEVAATKQLDAINKYEGEKPWTLTFCYGRAMQGSVLKAWAGKAENVPEAQRIFLHRARCNGLAALGQYEGETEA